MTEMTDTTTTEATNVEPAVTLEAQMRALLDALDKAHQEAATAKAEADARAQEVATATAEAERARRQAEEAKAQAELAKVRAEAEAERYLDKETRQRREAAAYTAMIRNMVTN
jgi:phage shock protein A